MGKRVYDESLKQMAIDLSYARGSVKEVAEVLGIDPARLSKWRNKSQSPAPPVAALTEV